MALVDTGLVVRYFLDEAASGRDPTAVLDSSGVGTAFDLTINYDTDKLAYTETSGNRGLESVSTANNQRANKAINNTSDKVRDNLHGSKTITVEIKVRVDSISSSNGRIFVINDRAGSNPAIGFTGTGTSSGAVYFNETALTGYMAYSGTQVLKHPM